MTGHRLSGLMDWLERDEWADVMEMALGEHIASACRAVGIEPTSLHEHVPMETIDVLWGCAMEDALTRFRDDGVNVVDDYLRRRGFRERPTDRAYMRALRNSILSLYEVVDIKPGTGICLRDLVRGGDPVWVSDVLASQHCAIWDCLSTRVVKVASRTVMSGGALPFDPGARDELLSSLEQLQSSGPEKMAALGLGADPLLIAEAFSTGSILAAAAPMFSRIWLEHRLKRKPPKVHNTDGDPISWMDVQFPLAPGAKPAAIRKALARLPELRREDGDFWNWRQSGAKAAASDVEGNLTVGSWLEDGSVVLGTIELKAGQLVLQVNSAARADRGSALLTKALGSLIGPGSTHELQSAADPEDLGRENDASCELPEGVDAEAVARDWFDRYYHDLLDQPVPALGGRTPREAAADRSDTRELIAWLKLMENNSGRPTGNVSLRYDLRWLWDELGVADLRG